MTGVLLMPVLGRHFGAGAGRDITSYVQRPGLCTSPFSRIGDLGS